MGGIISAILEMRGYEISGLNRRGGEYRTDLSTSIPYFSTHFDLVVHSAGKAHTVPKTPKEVAEFYNSNVKGTKNLLSALESDPPRSFVFISTVAVYGLERGEEITEEHPLLGKTPYAKSKMEAEELVETWGAANGIPVLILRLPLVAGPNPPGNLGKMIHGIKSGKYLNINKGMARRSVVLAEDVGYCIIDNTEKTGVYNLSDGIHPSFKELENSISRQLGKRQPFQIPLKIGKILGKAGDFLPGFPINSDTITKMSEDLTFSNKKALENLNWEARSVVNHFKIS